MAIAKRKKRFIDVEIPLIGRETQLIAYEVEELDGRYIKYDLTRILKGKSFLLDLKVSVKNGEAIATPTELRLVPYYIRRTMRKGTDYVEDSFSAKCRDAQILIKPLMITRRKVSKAVRKVLREKAKAEIEEYVKGKDYERIFEDVIRNKVQKEFSLKMKKIYPLSLFEIRVLKVEKVLENPKEESKKESVEKKSKKKNSEEKTEEVSESFTDEE